MKKLLALALVLTLVSACNGKKIKTAKAFVADLNAAYGPTSTVHAAFVKLGKDNKNFAVILISDNGGTYYAAVDLANYKPGKSFTELMNYILSNEVYQGLTPNGNGTYTCGAGCVNNLGLPTTSSMVFESTETSARDLETAAAFAEEYAVKLAAENLADKFALSAERSFEVASMMAQWNMISKKRAMTDADADAFALEAIGSTASEVKSAFERSVDGDASDLNALIDRAAEVNGVSSENMNKIVSELFL